MALNKKKKLANRKNYGDKRSTSSIKYIVWHYTAGDGDTDENNATYFNREVVYASAHYFVDDDSATLTVPEDYVAYAVGGDRYPNYKETGGAKHYGKCTNANSISIEICDAKKDGKIYPLDETLDNLVELTKELMKKYNIPASRVIRHFDVNGKSCPAYWVGSKAKEDKFKKVHARLTTTTSKKETVAKPSSYYPKYTGKSTVLDTVLKAIGVPSAYRGSWAKRKPLAVKNGLGTDYVGSASDNKRLVDLAKKGKLKRV